MSKQNKKPFSKAILVGEITDKKRGEFQAYTNDAGQSFPARPFLEFNVKTGDNSKIRCRVQNSSKEPLRVTNFDRYLNDGDYVKVVGRIDYRTDKHDASKVYITVQPYSIDKVSTENKPQSKFVLQGEVAGIDFGSATDRLKLEFTIDVTNSIDNGKVFTNTYPAVAYDETANDLAQVIRDGFIVLVVGDLVQRVERDEYDTYLGTVIEFEVKELREVISEGNESYGATSSSFDNDEVPF